MKVHAVYTYRLYWSSSYSWPLQLTEQRSSTSSKMLGCIQSKIWHQDSVILALPEVVHTGIYIVVLCMYSIDLGHAAYTLHADFCVVPSDLHYCADSLQIVGCECHQPYRFETLIGSMLAAPELMSVITQPFMISIVQIRRNYTWEHLDLASATAFKPH